MKTKDNRPTSQSYQFSSLSKRMDSIAQLEAELRAMRRQNEAQLQRIAYKFGQESLTLIDGDPNIRATVTDIVQKLVFQDEEGNTISPD